MNVKKFGDFINYFLGVVLSLVLTLVVLFMNNALNSQTYVVSFVIACMISFFIGYIIPAKQWGDKLAEHMKLKGIAAHLVSIAVLALFMVTCISFIDTFVSVGFNFIGGWLKLYPLLLLVGYIVLLFFQPLAVKLGSRIAKQ